MDEQIDSLYRSRMAERTRFLESLDHVPTPGWTRAAFSVRRAGKVEAGRDYRIARTVYPGQDVLYCLAGEGSVETMGQILSVGSGDLVWIANEQPQAHAAEPRRPWTLLWFRLDGPDLPSLRHQLFGDAYPRALPVGIIDPGPWFERLFVALRKREPDLDLRLNLLVAEFLTLIGRNLWGGRPVEVPAPLARLLAAMRDQLEARWSAEEVARVTGLGASQTRRLFQRVLRTTPRQWLLRERLIHAQSLLVKESLPLASIAEACGFCDVYHFSREFKQSVGVPPATWRRNELGASSHSPETRKALPAHASPVPKPL